ncbi:MAG: urease accessory protein UreE [Desulfobacterales bacterium]|nr:urease accessory protein UreE [Desulfobacterales bacterium]
MLCLTRKIIGCHEPATTLTLPWSQRTRSRLRVQLDNGEEAGLFLERGVILRDGDCLATDNGHVVRIRAAVETVSTVRSNDPLLLARICYHLGNRHVDLEIGQRRVRYLHDHVLDEMIRGMGLRPEKEQAPLEPETGAYGKGHGHRHE